MMMYDTLPAHDSAAWAQPVSLISHAMHGTGSRFPVDQMSDWSRLLAGRGSLQLVTTAPLPSNSSRTPAADLRTAAEHLVNIREVFRSAISDLADAFGVSRQAVYKWLASDAEPEQDRLQRIQALSRAADRFRKERIDRASLLVKMKVKDRKTLLDFIATGADITEVVETLITEAKLMREAHNQLGLNQSKTRPNESWRAEMSVPGSPE